ncbi:MAG: YHS domain-containing protein [Apibacter sp.]|jgi:YHS domain-containing protein|nr:YHS domain-containing protein [Apibacter sp.]
MKEKVNFIALSIFVMLLTNSCELKNKNHFMEGETISNVNIVNELDPVCEMPTSNNLNDTLNYQGKLYGFCSSHCKEEFKRNPRKYMSK